MRVVWVWRRAGQEFGGNKPPAQRRRTWKAAPKPVALCSSLHSVPSPGAHLLAVERAMCQ
eukprot:10983886-Prorocentrum_lima.AAC.1